MQTQEYETYYKQMLKEAQEYEDFAFEMLRRRGLTVVRYCSELWQRKKGECSGGVEVKYDRLFAETGNLFIEVSEKSHPDPQKPYFRSGIRRPDNSWLYAIGNYDVLYIFGKKHLCQETEKRPWRFTRTATAEGYLVPEEDAEYLAQYVIRRPL